MSKKIKVPFPESLLRPANPGYPAGWKLRVNQVGDAIGYVLAGIILLLTVIPVFLLVAALFVWGFYWIICASVAASAGCPAIAVLCVLWWLWWLNSSPLVAE